MQAFQEHYFTTDDGRRLYYRDYSGPASRMPVFCVPGLQTNSRVFEQLAPHIAKSRRVLCIDPRGKGRSEYDADPNNYTLRRDGSDLYQLAQAAHAPRGVVLGASRGGLAGLFLAAKTQLVTGLVLVDIGPQFEFSAVERLANDIAPDMSFASWEAAAAALKRGYGAWFPDLPDRKWLFWAKAKYREENERIVPDSDPQMTARIRKANAELSNDAILALWQMFRSMPAIPILVLRGEHSDVLLEQTVQKMQSIRPDIVAVTVKGCGHMPFLDEPESLAAIDELLARID